MAEPRRIDLKQYEDCFVPGGLEQFLAKVKELLSQNEMILVMDGDEELCFLVSPDWMKRHGLT